MGSKKEEEGAYELKVRELKDKIQKSLEKDMVTFARANPSEDPLRSRIYFLRNELAAQIVNVIQVNQTANCLIDRIEKLTEEMTELKKKILGKDT